MTWGQLISTRRSTLRSAGALMALSGVLLVAAEVGPHVSSYGMVGSQAASFLARLLFACAALLFALRVRREGYRATSRPMARTDRVASVALWALASTIVVRLVVNLVDRTGRDGVTTAMYVMSAIQSALSIVILVAAIVSVAALAAIRLIPRSAVVLAAVGIGWNVVLAPIFPMFIAFGFRPPQGVLVIAFFGGAIFSAVLVVALGVACLIASWRGRESFNRRSARAISRGERRVEVSRTRRGRTP